MALISNQQPRKLGLLSRRSVLCGAGTLAAGFGGFPGAALSQARHGHDLPVPPDDYLRDYDELELFFHDLAPGPDTETDNILVLCSDISGSISDPEYELQRHGTANALKSRDVKYRILGDSGLGSIVACYIEFGSYAYLRHGYALLDSEESIDHFADAVANTQRLPGPTGGQTNIYQGLGLGIDLIKVSKQYFKASRATIDISGDGAQSLIGFDELWRRIYGYMEKIHRDAATTQVNEFLPMGIQINGLVLPSENPADVQDYYRKWVATRNGRVFSVDDFDSFEEAMAKKLAFEIAYRGDGPLVKKKPVPA